MFVFEIQYYWSVPSKMRFTDEVWGESDPNVKGNPKLSLKEKIKIMRKAVKAVFA
jgi:hypothetical protein